MAGRSTGRLILMALLALGLAGGLAACGKKPGNLSPPADAEEIGYPRTYPAT
jgi:predicted small lipoprotein YifL